MSYISPGLEARRIQYGTIFDIKEFAIFDGPGIRQTVFLKGCPLHCSWCHNPEGQHTKPELMVSNASCLNCGACVAACKQESCIACGACIPVCPLHLRQISGRVLSAETLAEEILKNSDYYARYGGGVTFSGGEPLMQAPFLMDTLDRIPQLHRAIETSGYTDSETFREVVKRLEYVIMDIKLMDPALHRKYIGVDNTRILENAAYLCSQEKPFVIRIPMIPGVNDFDDNYRQTAAFLQGAKALEKVELLPYHKTAGAKYAMVGREYTPDFDPEQPIHIGKEIFENYGIRSDVL